MKNCVDKAHKRHIRAWRFFFWPVRLLLRLKFNFRPEAEPELPEGCLILSNHVTNWDPLMLGASFKQQMYFVASEHIFRMGLATKFLNRYFAPIARQKGATDASAAYNMLHMLKNGRRVMLFPEGNTSWNGKTAPMHRSVGRLARACGVPVVTYRLTGGYLTLPRWGLGVRKGKMTGGVVKVYQPEELKKMSREEAGKVLAADLFEDAYERQRQEPVRYCGRRRAERLESAFYICPACGGIETLRSEKNRVFCGCGFEAVFNDMGYFEGEKLPFKTTLEWDAWQEERMKALAEGLGDEAAFSDEEQTLWLQNGHEQSMAAQGRLSLYGDRLVLGEMSFPISEISEVSLFGRDHVVFTAAGSTYEIKSEKSRSGRKYMTLINYLKDRGCEN